jgi:hypothetical protein
VLTSVQGGAVTVVDGEDRWSSGDTYMTRVT